MAVTVNIYEAKTQLSKLVAQCFADDLVLVTGDRQLSEYPIETIR